MCVCDCESVLSVCECMCDSVCVCLSVFVTPFPLFLKSEPVVVNNQNVDDNLFSCGAAAQRWQWPPHS